MKHAYLIMAHNNLYILEKLLFLLDDEKNDIYVHIDKKTKNFDFNKYKNIIKKSKICFINRIDVRWGDYTQIKCELELLKEAVKTPHQYYHLLSGVDLPIKSQSEIHNFFDNTEKEFVHFRKHENSCDRIDRVNYYHLFYKNARSNSKLKVVFSRKLHSICLKIQQKINFNRVNDKTYFKDGANWFSITHNLALYVLSKETEIRKQYKYTFCADELFLQTLIFHSEFYDNLYSYEKDDYKSIKRVIDWKRGNPYTFKYSDFDELVSSDCFFARKFSEKDKELIDKIYNYIRSGDNV